MNAPILLLSPDAASKSQNKLLNSNKRGLLSSSPSHISSIQTGGVLLLHSFDALEIQRRCVNNEPKMPFKSSPFSQRPLSLFAYWGPKKLQSGNPTINWNIEHGLQSSEQENSQLLFFSKNNKVSCAVSALNVNH